MAELIPWFNFSGRARHRRSQGERYLLVRVSRGRVQMPQDGERQFLSGSLTQILRRRGDTDAAPAGSGENRFRDVASDSGREGRIEHAAISERKENDLEGITFPQ